MDDPHELGVAAIGQIGRLANPFDFRGRLDAADLLDVQGRGDERRAHGRADDLGESGFHLLEPVDRHRRRSLMRKQAGQSIPKMYGKRYAAAHRRGDGLYVPGICNDRANFATARKHGERLGAGEIHVDQATKAVLAPAVAVEHQQIPAALLHQCDKL